MVSVFYKRAVVQGKGMLVFAIFIALFTRLLTCLYSPFPAQAYTCSEGDGCLWYAIAPFFANKFISIACSALSVIFIAFLLSYINAKHLIIRQKTYLPAALSLLLYSMHPSFMFMGAHFIGVIFFLFSLSILFASYHEDKAQIAVVKIGFLFAICSLFFLHIFLYLFIFIIGLSVMRIFGIKPFLAFLFGIVLIYVPIFTFYFFSGNLDAFFLPFVGFDYAELNFLPLLSFSLSQWISFGACFLLLMIFIFNGYINSFKDKIKIRVFLRYLTVFCVYSILLLLLVNYNPDANLFFIFAVASFLFAHLFVLTDRRGIQLLFYMCFIIYLFFTASFFFFPDLFKI